MAQKEAVLNINGCPLARGNKKFAWQLGNYKTELRQSSKVQTIPGRSRQHNFLMES